jgi:hypothetical protein
MMTIAYMYSILRIIEHRVCIAVFGSSRDKFALSSPIIFSMPAVRMFYRESMMKFDVCFLQGNTLVGTHWEFANAEQVIGLMEAANCRFRDIQLVRQTLKEQRPGSIDIELSQEQFSTLKRRRQATARKRDIR